MQASSRSKRLNQNEDRIWIQAMAILVVFMIAVVAWRAWKDHQPDEIRFGAAQITIEPSGGRVLLPMSQAPAAEGGVIAISAGSLEAFVVKVSNFEYAVFNRTSARGRAVRYDQGRGIFVDRSDETFGFDRKTGRSVSAGVEDHLPKYLSLAQGDNLEIQLQMQ